MYVLLFFFFVCLYDYEMSEETTAVPSLVLLQAFRFCSVLLLWGDVGGSEKEIEG